ncbi:hypothetical protein tb265_41680 [Gemmatimonadetes bacterium T265]|nr:hypothetical protein tb265_41680 [Gemmatimonadetes bacterium T265]
MRPTVRFPPPERPARMLTSVRLAWRTLRRSPAYLAAAVLTLALGIGATTALFGVVDRVLVRPLPYHDPARLVRVWDGAGMADGLLEDVRRQSTAYAAVAGFGYVNDVTVLARGAAGRAPSPGRSPATAVTGNLFETLGAPAAIGRTLLPDDGRPGAPLVAVLSDAFWRERFGADPRVIGRQVTIDGEPHEVVGVMPAEFHFPSASVAIWTPAHLDPTNRVNYWWMWRLNALARLKPGVTSARAEAETRGIVGRAGRQDFPSRMQDDFGRDLRVLPLQAALAGRARTTLVLLFGGVVVMLVVAVVNATGLALVRAAGRARELTVRAAVGAGRGRLVAQLVSEGVVVAGLAAMLGTVLAWALTRALAAALPPGLTEGVPGAESLGLDARALLFACAAALAAGVGAALLPALGASRVDLRGALTDGARGTTGGAGGRRGLARLVAAQVALGVVLAARAGLLATSLARLRAVDPGFRADRVTVANVPLPSGSYNDAVRGYAFYDALLARVRALPGVDVAALASEVPFAGGGGGGVFEIEAHPRPVGGQWSGVSYVDVTPGTARALGIPLVAGRYVGDADRTGGPPVGVVDAIAAHKYWPEFADPHGVLGQRVRRPDGSAWITIVGVVGNVRRDSLSAEPQPTLYLPMVQDAPHDMHVVTRGSLDAARLAPALRRVVAELDPAVPVGTVRGLAAAVDDSAARARFVTQVLVAFAAAAVLLAAVGVYGVAAFAVARRTREVGVRVALGAAPAAIRAMVLRDGGRLAARGVAVGLVGAVAAGWLARGALYGVAPVEPGVLAAVAALFGAVALAATALPARRAARIDPLVALRAE